MPIFDVDQPPLKLSSSVQECFERDTRQDVLSYYPIPSHLALWNQLEICTNNKMKKLRNKVFWFVFNASRNLHVILKNFPHYKLECIVKKKKLNDQNESIPIDTCIHIHV